MCSSDLAYREPPYPTSVDLIAALREQTPTEHHGLLEDLFDRIVLYSNRVVSAVMKPLSDDRWEITLEVECRKFEADEKGNERELQFEEQLEVGAFGAAERGKEYGAGLARERVLVKSGMNRVVFVTSGAPETAGIDPFLLLVDRIPADNVRKVRTE